MALHEVVSPITVSTEVATWVVTPETERREQVELKNIFNGSFILSKSGEIYFLGRLRRDQKMIDFSKPDQTDMGFTKLQMVDGQLVEIPNSRKVLYDGAEGKEDPRIAVREDGTIMCGFTQVVIEDGKVVPYGASMILTEVDGTLQASAIRIYKEFGPGKNMTPTKDGFMFRQDSIDDGVENNHKLVAKTDENGDIVHSYEMSFKDCEGGIPQWGEFKMGTTGGTVSETIDKTGRVVEKTILVHGMKKSKKLIGGVEKDFYEYAIGAAELVLDDSNEVDEYKVKKISREPLISHLDVDGVERSDQRFVIYACDILHTEDGVIVAVNKGDDKTVFLSKTHEEIAASLQ